MEDREVIDKILQGDSSAYASLVRKYQIRLLQFCISMLGNLEEAEDALQEVFVKAFHSLGKFRKDSAFYTWIYRIAANHCLDQLRKRARRPTESWDALLDQKGSEIEKLLAISPEKPFQEAPERELVQKVLACLSPDHRLILTLREMQELSYEEIAQTLHCSLDAVKGRLKRAREDFREKLRHLSTQKAV